MEGLWDWLVGCFSTGRPPGTRRPGPAKPHARGEGEEVFESFGGAQQNIPNKNEPFILLNLFC